MQIQKVQNCSGPDCNVCTGADCEPQMVCENGVCYIVDGADDEPAVVASTPSNEGGISRVTNENYNSLIQASSGTTYVIIGGTKCGRCKAFAPVAEQVAANLEGSAKFVKLDHDTSDGLYSKILQDVGEQSGGHGLPIIVKYVDGKAVEFMEYSDIKSTYKNADAMTSFLGAKVEAGSAPAVAAETPVVETPAVEAPVTEAPVTEAPVTEAPAAEVAVQEASEQTSESQSLGEKLSLLNAKDNVVDLLNQKLEEINATTQSSSGASSSISSLIEGAASIADLKSIVENSSLSYDVQSRLRDIVKDLDDNADVDAAKSSLLALL